MRNVAGGEIVPWFYPVSGGAGSDGIYGQALESVYFFSKGHSKEGVFKGMSWR